MSRRRRGSRRKAIRFNIVRPGTIQQVDIPHDGDMVTITTTRENVVGVLAQLHRVHGYGGGWVWNAFVLFNDLASASCIVFALSGVYLWWMTAKRKIWGVLCLGASCAYTVGTISTCCALANTVVAWASRPSVRPPRERLAAAIARASCRSHINASRSEFHRRIR
jgi:hypothetical protein